MFSENSKNVRYRIKGIFFFLCILFLFASCEPVNRTDLTSPPVDSNAKTAAAISKANDPKSLVVSFSLVENADSYQVYAAEAKGSDGTKLGLEAIEPVSVSSSDFSGGKYRATLSGFVPGGSYDIFVQAKNNANSDWVTVWNDTYTVAAASPSVSEAPSYKIEPNSTKTSLSVYVNSTIGYKYLVTLTENAPATASSRTNASNVIRSDIRKGNGDEIEFSLKTSADSSYSMSISYAYITASDDSLIAGDSSTAAESTAVVDMSAFDGEIEIRYDDSTGEFVVTNLPEGTKSITISDYDGNISSTSIPVSDAGSEIKVDSSEFIEGLEHGYFYVHAVTDEGKTCTSINNVWCFRNPIYTEDDVKAAANWQTFSLAWDISSSIDAVYSVNVKKASADTSTVPEDPSRQIEATVNASGISITGLSSRTKYIAEVKIRTSDNESCVFSIPFETKSFAGTYKWENKNHKDGDFASGPANFAIVVSEGSESGKYQYSVSVADIDSDYDGTAHVVMPLVDTASEDIPSINYKTPAAGYEKANDAFKWNFKKWATIDTENGWLASMATPKSWQPTSVQSYRDYVKTNVTTETLMPADTQTEFMFRERDGAPVIIFKNFSSNTLAQKYIFSNSLQYQEEGVSDQYSFLLTLVEEVN